MWRVWRETRGARVLEATRERREALPVRARRKARGETGKARGARGKARGVQRARQGARRGTCADIRERRASLNG